MNWFLGIMTIFYFILFNISNLKTNNFSLAFKIYITDNLYIETTAFSVFSLVHTIEFKFESLGESYNFLNFINIHITLNVQGVYKMNKVHQVSILYLSPLDSVSTSPPPSISVFGNPKPCYNDTPMDEIPKEYEEA